MKMKRRVATYVHKLQALEVPKKRTLKKRIVSNPSPPILYGHLANVSSRM